MNSVEIMAPAGSYEAVTAAINAGANSIYFGAGQLNMRARSSANFQEDDIKKISAICAESNVKSYLVLNTIVYDNELAEAFRICDIAKCAKISAIIASDISIIQYAHNIGIEVHISVQANVSNYSAVKFFAQFADVVVLARELSIKQIKYITSKIKEDNLIGPSGNLIKIELFIHGALCVAISGKCYMSLALYNSSANRGGCYQTCRREYKVIDEQTDDELIIDNKNVMSPKDLCTITFLNILLDAGVSVLKIEGRGRSPDYVSIVVTAYKQALDMWKCNAWEQEKAIKLIKDLETVFNRGFWHGGYYLGEKLGEWCNSEGNIAKYKKEYIADISNYFSKIGVAELTMMAGILHVDSEIVIIGPTTGVEIIKVTEIRLANKSTNSVKKGAVISIPIPKRVRKNDKVYLRVVQNFGD